VGAGRGRQPDSGELRIQPGNQDCCLGHLVFAALYACPRLNNRQTAVVVGRDAVMLPKLAGRPVRLHRLGSQLCQIAEGADFPTLWDWAERGILEFAGEESGDLGWEVGGAAFGFGVDGGEIYEPGLE